MTAKVFFWRPSSPVLVSLFTRCFMASSGRGSRAIPPRSRTPTKNGRQQSSTHQQGRLLGSSSELLATSLLHERRLAFGQSLAIAFGIAAAATAGMIVLMSKWALPYSGVESFDELIQGQLARVTRPISALGIGEISFDADGVHHTFAAQSINGAEIPSDAEVVIDTVENGIARVEPWSEVEARL